MLRRLLLSFAAVFLAGQALAQSAGGYRATAWVKTAASQVRLILPERFVPGQAVHGGIEVQLEAGAKTYWRSPGETGVAPALDLTASRGLKHGSLLFPAPVAFDDGAGGIAIGYTDSLIFPLSLTAETTAPALLSVQFDFGVCHRNMCMPAAASFIVAPGEGEVDSSLAGPMASWLGRVPRRTDHPALAITTLTERRASDMVTLEITARMPASSERVLHAEAEGLTFTTRALDQGVGDTIRFEAISPLPADMAGKPTGPVTLTLIAGGDAIERTMTTKP
mgnify:CR=1 FL=1